MDLYKAIQELTERKKQLDSAIAQLEGLVKGRPVGPGKSRRGRKSMPEQERLVVSERMRRYWASRRPQSGSAA